MARPRALSKKFHGEIVPKSLKMYGHSLVVVVICFPPVVGYI